GSAATVRGVGATVLVIDNYDAFRFNLVQDLGELGAEPVVHRHDELTVDEIVDLDPDAVLISPGPGRPDDAGVSNAVIERLAGVKPILGVCLGHQCIGQVFGGTVVRAPSVMHGKTSLVHHDGKGLLAGLPEPFVALALGAGFWLITLPMSLSFWAGSCFTSTPKPAFCRSAVACAWLSPVTSGTVAVSGPVETKMVTSDLASACWPGAGSVVMT